MPTSAIARCLVSVLAFSALLAPLPAMAGPRRISAKIVGFECGDNCYLTVKPSRGAEITGLCVAPQCQPWNEATKLPRRVIGARVIVTLGTGRQLDAEGNDMGPFPSITAISGLLP